MDPKVHAQTSPYSFMGGKAVGFVFSYALFTTMLYVILHTTNKIPETWSPVHIAGIVGVVTISGWGLRKIFSS